MDSASTFSFAGEAVLLLLLQIGGVGYMTFMSFAYLLMRNSLGRTQTDLLTSRKRRTNTLHQKRSKAPTSLECLLCGRI